MLCLYNGYVNIHIGNNFIISSDEGLTLETPAFLIFHGGYSTVINSFDKTQFCFHSPIDAAPQIL